MAFGTGTHETTQIASQLIHNLLTENKINSAVDVGTGSGILALLLGLYGVESIWAYDNDDECERVFKENRDKNNQPQLQWESQWGAHLKTKVQLTVANIIDGVLLDLKSQFKDLNSTYYIFTGILEEREELFLKEMLDQWPLKQRQRLQKGEWVGFCFEVVS